MHRDEMRSCLLMVKGIFAFGINDDVVNIWEKLIGRYYSADQFRAAFDLYCETGEKAPNIPQMKGCLRTLFGAPPVEVKPTPKANLPEKQPPSKIQICMDVLTPQYVTQQLKSIVGEPTGSGDWSKLVSKKDWVPLYKAKLEELYGLACEKIKADQGYVPPSWPEPSLISSKIIRDKTRKEGVGVGSGLEGF